jgi:hypothetical protein
MDKNTKAKYTIFTINIKDINKAERAIYNEKRLYVWYGDNPKRRIDLECQNKIIARKIYNRCSIQGGE